MPEMDWNRNRSSFGGSGCLGFRKIVCKMTFIFSNNNIATSLRHSCSRGIRIRIWIFSSPPGLHVTPYFWTDFRVSYHNSTQQVLNCTFVYFRLKDPHSSLDKIFLYCLILIYSTTKNFVVFLDLDYILKFSFRTNS